MSHVATNWAFAVRGVPPMAKLVLIALADRHNKDTNLCCPDQKMIADDVSLTDRTVRKFVVWLEKNGFLTRRVQSRGLGVTTYYTLHFTVLQPQEVETNRKTVPEGSDAGPTGTRRTTNRNEEDNQPEAAFRNKGTVSNRKEPSVSKETAKGDLLGTPPRQSAPRHKAAATAERATKDQLQKAGVFSMGLQLLLAEDVPEPVARKFLGGLIKNSSIAIAYAAVQAAAADPPIDARGYLSGVVERKAKAAGLRSKPQTNAASAPNDDGWDAAVTKYARSGIWPQRLGDRPDEYGYRGPVEPLEAVMATGSFGFADPRGLKENISRLRTA